MTTLTDYERTQLAAIETWKNESEGFVSRVFERLTIPIDWLIQRVIPEALVEGASDLVNAWGQTMTAPNDVLRRSQLPSIESLRGRDLQLCDRLADGVHNRAIAAAIAEGSATGGLGIVGMPVDIPVILTLAMRTIHQIGLCYGYECRSSHDEAFALRVLSMVGASGIEGKLVFLGGLSTLRWVIVRQTWNALARNLARRAIARGYTGSITFDVATVIGTTLVRRRALVAIPIVGGLLSAAMNGRYVTQVGWAARRCFQEKWLADAGKLTPAIDEQ